jgi:multiple sugar transport system ATP-binding protein
MNLVQRNQRVMRAAGILGIEQLLDRRPGQLSGGQRQRVAMGRAIVRDPKVFLFDEPLSNLDAKLRVQMRSEIRALHQRLETTCIYVTHDQIEAMTMADKIVVMNNGIVEQIGTPLALYDRPGNVFVAAFLGSPAMNFLEGSLVGGDKPAFVTKSGLKIGVPSLPRGYVGGPVVCGFRPEAVALGVEPSLPAIVRVIEPTGSETHVFAKLEDTEIVAILRERIALPPGAALPIFIAPESVHLFDAATTQRMN